MYAGKGSGPDLLTFLAVGALVIAGAALADRSTVRGNANAAVLARIAGLAGVRRIRHHVA